MKRLWRLLMVDPAKDLLRFKSFFVLIFIVMLIDHGIKYLKVIYHFNLKLPRFWRFDPAVSANMLFQMPGLVFKRMGPEHLFLIIVGLHLIRQMVLLWPAGDLRRMHRDERGPFGLWASLATLGWNAVCFHAAGLAVLWSAACIWGLAWFGISRFGWQHYRLSLWLWLLAFSLIAVIPLMSAAFSYSSRLAVNSEGGFGEKFRLLFKLFTDWRIMAGSWLFFAFRFILEAVFMIAIPIYLLMSLEKGAPKLFLLALLATPAAAYLEMVSFKIFLTFYGNYPPVRREYEKYFNVTIAELHRT